jgi:hypothetical protein
VNHQVYALGVAGALLVMALVVELLRRRYLRGKYAVLWLGLSVAITVLAVFPDVLGWLAIKLGVQVPSNLLFFGAIIMLLLVVMQLSYESSRLEEETRTLAEEIGLLRLEVDKLRDQPLKGTSAGRHG